MQSITITEGQGDLLDGQTPTEGACARLERLTERLVREYTGCQSVRARTEPHTTGIGTRIEVTGWEHAEAEAIRADAQQAAEQAHELWASDLSEDDIELD